MKSYKDTIIIVYRVLISQSIHITASNITAVRIVFAAFGYKYGCAISNDAAVN